MLFVLRSSACLASSSGPLRPYVFSPNKFFSLASFGTPPSLRGGLNRLSHGTEPDLCIFTCFQANEAMLNHHGSAGSVAPDLVRPRIQHSPFAFRLAGYSTVLRDSVPGKGPSSLELNTRPSARTVGPVLYPLPLGVETVRMSRCACEALSDTKELPDAADPFGPGSCPYHLSPLSPSRVKRALSECTEKRRPGLHE